ncbi:hypothetical protein TEQG_00962 [Trichophyton equinum CBS 127.97]|uniref:Uncharacterized protein n=1 Tax=Trichophyton equinum (strain ATCC MYA-4606 / CBS 127.97) TaxID=559882 RepID=F2PJ53_TRIEC|nr:hypothetical protein TEQG_00962 [Trichophyton equinum CBS 127.97]
MAERASDLCCSLGIIIIIITCWQGEVTLSLARIVSRTQPLAVRGGAGAGVAQSDLMLGWVEKKNSLRAGGSDRRTFGRQIFRLDQQFLLRGVTGLAGPSFAPSPRTPK